MYNLNDVIKFGVSPSGKASDSDSDIRKFESYHPSQNINDYNIKSNKNVKGKVVFMGDREDDKARELRYFRSGY